MIEGSLRNKRKKTRKFIGSNKMKIIKMDKKKNKIGNEPRKIITTYTFSLRQTDYKVHCNMHMQWNAFVSYLTILNIAFIVHFMFEPNLIFVVCNITTKLCIFYV